MNEKINHLSEYEIRTILRAADDIIAQGGRTLLAKILKGSREKKVLQLELDQSPVYGCFRLVKLEDVIDKIDWMMDHDFLGIEYSGKLPMIVFTERGWQIESDQRADELLSEWKQWLEEGKRQPEMSYLKDRNRHMIFLFLEKIRETQDRKYIPYLLEWEKIDYKKVRAKIRATIKALEANDPIDHENVQRRKASIKEALKGSAPQDLLLKCWECGKRFTFTVGEQQFYKQKGFVHPKRCEECRARRNGDIF
ncbi:zinc-ribbon domain containing protein [Salicibibacter cibarius]|uniref:Zinc-ribbon domain containing protein n=1 Tax=Salicibibacter cibarius TaxID=2743000 RepID=A0A7T6Z4R9_9BACI|nr:RQC-minor-1 family DNA-binding protein [Salicibibacter cibarius]QQK76978.1 zinc-ribbon domain containing protein [Salicibibacter cibarius]